MSLTSKRRQQLKALAHKLKPIVLVGNTGLSALNDHELIKMRINTEDRVERKSLLAEICNSHRAELVQVVGKIGVIYRANKDTVV
jgi:RNA-binding protein